MKKGKRDWLVKKEKMKDLNIKEGINKDWKINDCV